MKTWILTFLLVATLIPLFSGCSQTSEEMGSDQERMDIADEDDGMEDEEDEEEDQ